MSAVTTNLQEAFDQIDAFRAIHQPGVEMVAVLCLQEAVGIDDTTRGLIADRLYSDDRLSNGSAVFLGVIIGLLASQFNDEAG